MQVETPMMMGYLVFQAVEYGGVVRVLLLILPVILLQIIMWQMEQST